MSVKTKSSICSGETKEIEEYQTGVVEMITNLEGRTVQIVRTPYGICSANARRVGVTDEQLAQL
ncbi:MAG TPA: hypothetical protein VGN20_06515, partial [Mucilaginibacter sp.]